ncbi:hypothetical protein WD202_003271 [Salmonella enterica]
MMLSINCVSQLAVVSYTSQNSTKKNNSERDAEIFREYKRGAFVNELAVKHNVSLQAIYNAIKKERIRQDEDSGHESHN